MKMKQIAARDMQEAMALARRDLGENAILLHTRKVPKGIVVTFATEPEETILSTQIVGDEIRIKSPATAYIQIDHPALASIDRALDYHRVPEPMLSRLKIAVRGAHIPAATEKDAATAILTDALNKAFQFHPLFINKTPPQKACMFVGTHGAGKTTAIAKFATLLTLEKKPIVLISTDTERLGGTDALAGLSDMLKAPFFMARDRSELKTLVKQYLGKAWILIDSFGVNIYAFEQLKALGELASLHDIEPVMVYPAGMDADESQEMANVFSFLPIERMLITRGDATRHFNGVFAALAHTRYHFSHMSMSARPADACQPITSSLLAQLLLNAEREHIKH